MYKKVVCISKGCQILSLYLSWLLRELEYLNYLSQKNIRNLGSLVLNPIWRFIFSYWIEGIGPTSLRKSPSLRIHCDKQWAVPLHPDLNLTHICHCQGKATARTSPSNTKQEEEVQPSLLGCPDQAVEKSPTFLGFLPAIPCRAGGLRGVCIILGSLFEWWTEPHLSSLCKGLATTGWKGRVWMRCMFLWLCHLPR